MFFIFFQGGEAGKIRFVVERFLFTHSEASVISHSQEEQEVFFV